MDTEAPSGRRRVTVVDEPPTRQDWFEDREAVPSAADLAARVDGVDARDGTGDDAEWTATVATPDDLRASDADVVVAPGLPAVLAAVHAGVDAPLLPVAAGRAVRSVPADGVGDALAAVTAGQAETTTYPVYAVSVGDADPVRTFLDVMLVTTDPARISEYTVHRPGTATTGDGAVGTFRADGVVVSTPAGSHGYGRAAEGPIVAPATDALSVVPVASFRTDPDQWILDGAGVTCAVERDEGPVSVYADGRECGRTDPSTPVRMRRTDGVDLLVVPGSEPFFGSG